MDDKDLEQFVETMTGVMDEDVLENLKQIMSSEALAKRLHSMTADRVFGARLRSAYIEIVNCEKNTVEAEEISGDEDDPNFVDQVYASAMERSNNLNPREVITSIALSFTAEMVVIGGPKEGRGIVTVISAGNAIGHAGVVMVMSDGSVSPVRSAEDVERLCIAKKILKNVYQNMINNIMFRAMGDVIKEVKERGEIEDEVSSEILDQLDDNLFEDS